jgi:hypothetical protein
MPLGGKAIDNVTTATSPESFSLLGGPLYGLGRRLGLVRGETNTLLLGLALGWGLWFVIVALTLIEGATNEVFSMLVVGAHARLLLIIPLFFLCESWVFPRMTAFVGTITRSGVVPPDALPALNAEVLRIHRWTKSWWPEAVCLLIALVLEVTRVRLQMYGETGGFSSAQTGVWFVVYFRVGLTLFRFLQFRWIWKWALWCRFLWRVSRLNLHLIPGHPDRAGGLGSLEGVHERFTPLVMAFSVLECASFAESISAGRLAATALYPSLTLLLLVDSALFLAPLLVFTDKLWDARTKGVGRYMGLATRYVAEFETKWLRDDLPADPPLLGSPDLQSLADLANAVSVVKGMRWVTIGPRLLTMMTLAAVVPLAPLLLFQYPIAELTQMFFSRLVGF